MFGIKTYMAMTTFMSMKLLIQKASDEVFTGKMSQKLRFGNILDVSLTDNKIFSFDNGVF